MPEYAGGDVPELNYERLLAENRQRGFQQLAAAREAASKYFQEHEAAQAANAAATSPFGQSVAQSMMQPVQPLDYKPSMGALAPGVGEGYQTLTQAAPLPQGLQRAQELQQKGPLQQAMEGAMREPGWGDRMQAKPGEPWRPGEVSVGALSTPQQAPTPALQQPQMMPPPQRQLGPQNAAEMALLQKMAPYIAQRRVAEEQYRTGTSKEILHGEAKHIDVSARLAEDMWKTAYNDQSKMELLRLKQQGGPQNPFDWKVANAGLTASLRAASGAEQAVIQMQAAGWNAYPEGTEQRNAYNIALMHHLQANQYSEMWQSVFTRTAGEYLGGPMPGGTAKPGNQGQPVPPPAQSGLGFVPSR